MKKYGFLRKQILFYALVMMTTFLILISSVHIRIMDDGREKNLLGQELLTASSVEQVDSYLDQLMLTAAYFAHDSEIVNMMEQLHTEENDPTKNHFETNPDAQAQISQIFTRSNAITPPILHITVYNEAGDFVCTDPTPEHLLHGAAFVSREDRLAQLQERFSVEQREFLLMGPDSRLSSTCDIDESVIRITVPIRSYDGAVIYGYLDVYQSVDTLLSRLNRNRQASIKTYLAEDSLLFHLNQSKQASIETYLFLDAESGRGRQFYPADRPFPDTDTGDYLETEMQSHYGWYVVVLQKRADALTPYKTLLVCVYLGCLALFLMMFACVFLIVRHYNKPILELSRRVKEASLTNLPDLPVTDNVTNDIRELEHAVNHMLQRIKASVELEQQAYLNALQAQMKPHFLYNCLSVISSISRTECETSTVPQFCSHLAAMLRYETTYQNDLVRLEDELENIRNYLALMKVRYAQYISYEVQAEEALLQLPLPRLVLQPLVENCFKHGFKAVAPPWHLSVRAFREDRQWVIQVADNGIGFDDTKRQELEQQAETLMNHLSDGYTDLKIGGLGLANTIVRLRLMSTDPVFFSITPNEPTGAIITLRGELHD